MIDHGLGSWGAREFESLSRGTLWLAEAWNTSRAAGRPDRGAAGVPGADEIRVAAALRLHPPLDSLRFLEHNGQPVAFNTFSPGGRWLCTLTLPGDAAGAGEVYLWDARTGERVTLSGVHPGAVHAAFDRDEDLLATAHADGGGAGVAARCPGRPAGGRGRVARCAGAERTGEGDVRGVRRPQGQLAGGRVRRRDRPRLAEHGPVVAGVHAGHAHGAGGPRSRPSPSARTASGSASSPAGGPG